MSTAWNGTRTGSSGISTGCWSVGFQGQTLDTTRWDYRNLGPRRDAVNVKETWRPDAHRDRGVSCRDEYIILSLQVGRWAGDIAQAELPDHLCVDYVRIYQKQDK